MALSQGHIIYIKDKNRPNDSKKSRPAVVVSISEINQEAPHVIVVPTTSTIRPGPFNVELKHNDGGLPNDSTVLCDQVFSVPKDAILGGPLGRSIPSSKLRKILVHIGQALGI